MRVESQERRDAREAKRDPRKSGLLAIPGVGPSLAGDLHDLGVHRVEDLRGADPEDLYDRLCALREASIDRCVLYVFRCATYFANHQEHDPELLQWWKWKDKQRSEP